MPPPGLTRSLSFSRAVKMASREQSIAELESSRIELVQRLDALQGTIEGLTAGTRNQEATANQEVLPNNIRTQLPDKFEVRMDDFPKFIADIKSYCAPTRVPQALQVDCAYRCLGKQPRKVWLAKRTAWERTHPGEEVTLDVFDSLLSNAYDNQDRATKARKKLDTVYQGNESLEKYVERITTLFGEIEAHKEPSMGESTPI